MSGGEVNMTDKRVTISWVVLAVGVIFILFSLLGLFYFKMQSGEIAIVMAPGVLFFIVGALGVAGYQFTKIGLGEAGTIELQSPSAIADIQPKTLPPDVEEQRRAHAGNRPIPGAAAPAFNVLSDVPDLRVMPLADPMVPMYMLDKNYRILDWNEAFSLVFDRTMEGRRGQSVLEWVYFLDNYEQVLDHGIKAFSDVEALPVIDVEPIQYTSARYGPINATKRAYQIPDDSRACAGWLVILDVAFGQDGQANRYQLDLINILQRSLMWSEYATSYDIVLESTDVYPKLIQTMVGENGKLSPIPKHTRVLDLGAGTGNITRRLADPSKGRIVFAIDDNRAMLNLLKHKCKPYLRQDDQGSGVIAIKQNVSSLFGLHDDYFDHVVMNNVLYSLDDPSSCLREVHRVLKPGGEVRISGPQKRTNVDHLFREIKTDLQKKKEFDNVREHYDRMERINKTMLAQMPNFRRWKVDDVQTMLTDAGFSKIAYSTDEAYAGQAMIVCARK
jgi:ubiquinone/menaquinone biosynthesis C-methylase UbiE